MPLISPVYEDTDVSLLHRVKHNSIEMMLSRGFSRREENILKMDTEGFYKHYDNIARKSNLSFTTALDINYDNVKIIFLETEKDISIDETRGIINSTYESGIRHLIVITKRKFNSDSKKWLQNLKISFRVS